MILQILFFVLRRQPVALSIPDKLPSFHHSLKDMRCLMGCNMKEFHEVLPTADIVLRQVGADSVQLVFRRYHTALRIVADADLHYLSAVRHAIQIGPGGFPGYI